MKAKIAKKLPPPRVRFEPPTIEEAIAAAQGLSTEFEEQVAIAAGLMGVSEDEVRPVWPKPVIEPARGRATSLMVRDRIITVERRGARVPRLASASADRTAASR